ncbi:FUSC family protein [Komagataeibacter sucrofermentans]|uniref:Fusaric acid resistance protein FusB n=2 Tax=Komagataeibacter sucrofermentans TaxID=1053551 RepID=A0A318QP53_9PROT|nr:FUSC family protein [Komagataeibacter sucrofermentans]PYD80210.1 fusaric acid resistance protein FusB [Komagataeibacter sucrofermentans]
MLSSLKRIFSDDAQWAATRTTAAFSARALLSVGIALFLAFSFQLQSPMSSVTTVMIVANPTVGALVSKSVWRIIGTIIGATISVGLMAVFVQSPVLYFMGLSVVVGLACMAATFLRLFRAYAAVLTGYTIVIISAPAFDNPDGIFLSAMSRLAAVVVGIVTTAAVFMVTSPRRSDTLFIQIHGLFRDTVNYILAFHQGYSNVPAQNADAPPGSTFRALPSTFHDSRAAMLTRIARLSDAVEYAAADNYDISVRQREIRAGLARLSGIVASYHPHTITPADTEQDRAVHGEIVAMLHTLLDLTKDQALEAMWTQGCARIQHARAIMIDEARATHSPRSLLFLDDIQDLLGQIDTALQDLSRRGSAGRRLRLQPYLEWPTALRNAARGALITLLATLIWYVLHWTAGPTMMLYVVAAASLLSTLPSASRAAGMMAAGTALGIPAGLLCHIFLLPQIDGYPLLWLSLCIMLLPGVWLQFHPKFGVGGFGYGVFSTVMLQVNNPIHYYNDISLFNGWMALFMGCIMLVLSFRVILPPNHRLDAARLVMSLTRSLHRLALSGRRQGKEWLVWENLQLQKVIRLAMRLSFFARPASMHEYIDAALATLSLGRLIERIRTIAGSPDIMGAQQAAIYDALDTFSELSHNPLLTAASLRRAATILCPPDALTLRPAAQVEAMACLEQAARIIEDIPGFLDQRGPLQWAEDYPAAHRPPLAAVRTEAG